MSGRLAIGAVAGLALALGVSGCAVAGGGFSVSASPAPPSAITTPPATPSATSSPSPSVTVDAQPLEVRCDENLVAHVSSETVTATSAGVPLLVSSEAPAGAYLNYMYGGDPLPAKPERWVLSAAPGPLTLSCSTPEVEGAEVAVTVVDPQHYWSDATLDDYGCSSSAIVDWAVGPGTGATPNEAIADLVASFHEVGVHYELSRAQQVALGYPDASRQTWVIGSESAVEISADVEAYGERFQAFAGSMCDHGAWPADA